MPLIVECECGNKVSVGEEHAGKRFKCKACGRVLQVPHAEAAQTGASEAPDAGVAAWHEWIRGSQAQGSTRRQIREEMEAQGIAPDQARVMIDDALTPQEPEAPPPRRAGPRSSRQGRHVRAARASSSGEFPGWLLWIGALVLVNVLSYIFDWSFWIY